MRPIVTTANSAVSRAWQRTAPFYQLRRLGPIGPFVAAVICAALFFGLHYGAVGARLFGDFSWFLGVLIFIAAMSVQYATWQLEELSCAIGQHADADAGRRFMAVVRATLRTRWMVAWGIFFGACNVSMGVAFGPPYEEALPLASVLVGYFIAGFVCGFAVRGIWGVCRASRRVATVIQKAFDFTAPDRCGGTAFIGDSLIVFSGVTLVTGVAISIYILFTQWHGTMSPWSRWLLWSWVAFPYVMAMLVLVAPALPLHRALLNYKREQGRALHDEIVRLRKAVKAAKGDATKQKAALELLQFNQALSAQLYGMRTWPMDLDAQIKLAAVVVVNVFSSAASVVKWISQHPELFYVSL
jgi:hypothetical protein